MSHNVVVLNEVIRELGRADSQGPDVSPTGTLVQIISHYLCGYFNGDPEANVDKHKELEALVAIVLRHGTRSTAKSEYFGADGMCPACEEYGCDVPYEIHLCGPRSVQPFRQSLAEGDKLIALIKDIYVPHAENEHLNS